jgi:hypothetical protein
MPDVTFESVVGLEAEPKKAEDTINANLDRLEAVIETLLMRANTQTNQMERDLELGENALVNVGVVDVITTPDTPDLVLVPLTDLEGDPATSETVINDNFDLIHDKLLELVSRLDQEVHQNVFDMNGHNLLNVREIVTDTGGLAP